MEDPELPRHAYLVHARGGTVWVFDLTRPKLEPKVLPYDAPMALGTHHHLLRVSGRGAHLTEPETGERSTLSIGDDEPVCSFTVLVGRGADARRIVVSDKPVRIGSAQTNDLVLLDPTVSAQHCRLEPDGQKLIVRDLESTNGTYLQGVRITQAQVSPGSQLRIGRTDLRVVASTHERKRGAHPPLIAASSAMQGVVAEAQHFAQLPWPILILGPSGAGKEELAAVLHRESARPGPFVALNAGGLPRELIESELFGHEKGAFTGAAGTRRGAFEQADGGTLLLDEIGELPLDLQTRLLRVLETWQIRRVGAEQGIDGERAFDLRHPPRPRQMVQAGSFRQDLYYRLAQTRAAGPRALASGGTTSCLWPTIFFRRARTNWAPDA